MKRRTTTHRYPRTARLNELMREIIADELERIDSERLAMVTVTDVHVDADLGRAVVFFDALDAEHDTEIIEAFGEIRHQLQKAIARQATTRRTPVLTFRPDLAIRAGERVDALVRDDLGVQVARPPQPDLRETYKFADEDDDDDELDDGLDDGFDDDDARDDDSGGAGDVPS